VVREKRMDQTVFDQILRDKTAFAESLRERQDEKQAVLDEFGKELGRFRGGKISKKAINASVPKVKKELSRLDKEIRKDILGVTTTSKRATKFAQRQTPRSFIISSRLLAQRSNAKRTTRKVAKKTETARRTTKTTQTARSTTAKTATRARRSRSASARRATRTDTSQAERSTSTSTI